MKLTHALTNHRPLIEPLEQRIAPALLVDGANLLGGAGNPTTGSTSVGGNSVTLVTVLSGDAIVWFDHGIISAISVGPNTALNITGDVGIIVGNLTATGQLSNSSISAANGLNGDVLLPNNIMGITTHPLSNELGSIGSIITGGSISNLNISGNLSGVYAGTGAFYDGNVNPLLDSRVLSGGFVTVNTGVDVNPIMPGIQGGFAFSAGNVKTVTSGASITNVKMGSAEELQMFAGNGLAGSAASLGHTGTPGLPGGSISNITIKNSFVDVGLSAKTPSYNLMAGSGGNGTKGGVGGSIQGVNEYSSNGVVDLFAGQGGNGVGGAGGAGGSIGGLNMESDSSAYTVQAGNGGTGAPGGPGGSVKGTNFGLDSLSSGIIVAAPFTVNGGNVDDVLLVDSLTGTMVIEQNSGNLGYGVGQAFTPVVQDSVSGLNTIAPIGTTPSSAVAVDLGTGHGLDIVVAYKGSNNLGVFINQGGGIFYAQNFGTGGNYTGDTLKATSIPLPYSPMQIAAGDFNGDGNQDIAVAMAVTGGGSEVMALTGNGLGGLSVPSVGVTGLPSNTVSLITADIQGKTVGPSNLPVSDLFLGFESGQIDSLLATAASSGAQFTPEVGGVSIGGGIGNLDYNGSAGALLVLDGLGDDVLLYGYTPTGVLFLESTISLKEIPGTPLVAHFVPTQLGAEPIEVLSSTASGSRIDNFTWQGTGYVDTSTVTSSEALKNFVPVVEGATSGVAAVGGALEHFSFSQDGASFYDIGLPFSGKKVNLTAGNGGDGINAATNIAAGGAGGEVYGMNIFAGDIIIQAGNGGSSINAPAGAGGIVGDTPVLVTITGQSVSTILEADYILTLTAGTGGSAAGTAHAAIGGAGGALQGLDLSMLSGNIVAQAGDGGSGGGGAGGSGGSILALKSVDYGGNLSLNAGDGGAAYGAVGNGGVGGSILDTSYSLSLTNPGTEIGYTVGLTAGFGGSSASVTGGAGGSVEFVNLTLQPANESVTDGNANPPTAHADVDSTLAVTIAAGYGGAGATGGAGGLLKSITTTAVYEQLVVLVGATPEQNTTFPEVNPVVAQLTSGYGGAGSKGAGGAGGAISALNLVGISHYDPDSVDPYAGQVPLVITSGYGGNGATVGGVGGAITGITSQNAGFLTVTSGSVGPGGGAVTTSSAPLNLTELSGATITSGSGGDGGNGNGGVGGTISNLNIGVSGFIQYAPLTVSDADAFVGGQLTVQSGSGGSGGTAGKGGAGGNIVTSFMGCADAYEQYGLLLQSGAGGAGTLGGGLGGNVTNIQLNAPQNPVQVPVNENSLYDALSTLILAGNGGGATGATAVGGTGGSISQIVQSKDVNSSINVIQAGNGGAAVKTGGLGGSVTNIKTVGLIGQASDDLGNSFGAFQTAAVPDVFNSLFPYGEVPNGVFAGRGGTGATNGLAGSVISISAAQIAAIGAAVDSNGLFAAATKVANITAQVIAYDVNQNGSYDNVPGTGRTQDPGDAVAIDGFIFSINTPTGIKTSNNTLLNAFTFA